MSSLADAGGYFGGRATVFRWRDEGFEFASLSGESLDADDLNEVEAAGRNRVVLLDRNFWVEGNKPTYRLTGEDAWGLYQQAREEATSYDAGPTDFVLSSFTHDYSDAGSDRTPAKYPHWEGAEGYRMAALSLDFVVRSYYDKATIRGAVGVAADAISALSMAHPIVISPAQVQAIEKLDFKDSISFLQSLQLPFDPLFIDTMGGPDVRDSAWIVDKHGTGISLGGMLLKTAAHSNAAEHVVIPFGAAVIPHDFDDSHSVTDFDQADRYDGHQVEFSAEEIDAIYGVNDVKRNIQGYAVDGMVRGYLMSDPGGHGLPSHAPTGAILIGAGTEAAGKVVLQHTPKTSEALDYFIPIEDMTEEAPPELGNQFELMYVGADLVGGPEDTVIAVGAPYPRSYAKLPPEKRANRACGWAQVIVEQFCAGVSALQILQAANVQIEPLQVSRQVRRQAERKGHSIAHTIRVHHVVSRTSTNGKGGTREYSHQFEVGGSLHHVKRGTSVNCRDCHGEGKLKGPLIPGAAQEEADCERCQGSGLDPEKITPCRRRYDEGPEKGELTCPNGCRKRWLPPHIKGDPSKPLVMKTRKVV